MIAQAIEGTAGDDFVKLDSVKQQAFSNKGPVPYEARTKLKPGIIAPIIHSRFVVTMQPILQLDLGFILVVREINRRRLGLADMSLWY